MEGRGSAVGLLAVAAMVLLLVMAPGVLAANHVVGGTQDWQFPPTNDATYYAQWSANQTFAVGDTLQFEYSASVHNVVQLGNLADYTACTLTAVKSYATGNDSVPLTAAGTFYYVCGVPGHCGDGMKFSVNVSAVAPASPPTTTPSPPSTTPSPPAGTTPPPPPNAASSGPVLSMAGLLIAALVASLAFLV